MKYIQTLLTFWSAVGFGPIFDCDIKTNNQTCKKQIKSEILLTRNLYLYVPSTISRIWCNSKTASHAMLLQWYMIIYVFPVFCKYWLISEIYLLLLLLIEYMLRWAHFFKSVFFINVFSEIYFPKCICFLGCIWPHLSILCMVRWASLFLSLLCNYRSNHGDKLRQRAAILWKKSILWKIFNRVFYQSGRNVELFDRVFRVFPGIFGYFWGYPYILRLFSNIYWGVKRLQ